MKEAGAPDDFHIESQGPDILAASDSEIWEIECKASTTGTSQTERDKFERALAAVVSYYGGWHREVAQSQAVVSRRIALAIPSTPGYSQLLRRLVRQPLRTRLELWVLLIDPRSSLIMPVAPTDDYPSVAA